MQSETEKWTSQIEVIKLRHPLLVKIKKNNVGVDVTCKTFNLIGSGENLTTALEMLFDHLFIDYYEYSLNPGVQSLDDKIYGKRVKSLFNCERKPRILLDINNNL